MGLWCRRRWVRGRAAPPGGAAPIGTVGTAWHRLAPTGTDGRGGPSTDAAGAGGDTGGRRDVGERFARRARALTTARTLPGGPVRGGAVLLLLLLLPVYGWAADIRGSRGAAITGDEPFYLVTTQSLLDDHNLDLRRQYRERTYTAYFDHPAGLWAQSVPLEDGRLVSPHNVGLSVLLLPGFGWGGLGGAQAQLVLLAALTWAGAYVLTVRWSGARPRIAWPLTAAVALSATATIYAAEVYPEMPAAAALVAALLLLPAPAEARAAGPRGAVDAGLRGAVGAGPPRIGAARALLLVLVLSALPWLGAKYAPLAGLVAAWAFVRADGGGRWALAAGGIASAGWYAWFHLQAFEALTPYHVNLVYAGGTTVEIVEDHVAIGDRVYRLWGLWVDRRFGVGRWAPLLLAAAWALPLLAGEARQRLVLALILVQLSIATFVAITMMGWWFPGRTLVTIFPLLPLPLALLALRLGRWGRALLGALAVASVATTVALVRAGRAGELTVAVDPFDLRWAPFRAAGRLFPQYTAWSTETWLLTVAWLAAAAALGAVALGALSLRSAIAARRPGGARRSVG